MTQKLWTSHDAMAATGGTSNARWSASGISIDSRTTQRGDLFVALGGPNFDGHDYVKDAFARGAAAAIVSRQIDTDDALLLVDDTLQALRDLAKAARARSQARIIALTGSVGKTGTKEALRHLLSLQGPTHASAASFNNHWGAPLSLALLPPGAQYAVFELGMNHPGEIEPLSLLVRPHVALVTNVEAVHLGPVGSLEAIAAAKAEIFAGLAENGYSLINTGSHNADILKRHARGTVLTFGPNGADATIEDIRIDGDGSTVKAFIRDRPLSYRVPIAGRHNADNSLAVLLAIDAIGADMAKAAASYSTLASVSGRGDRAEIRIDGGTITLIDETHNASPVATKAALHVLGMIPAKRGGRRIAVLGDMLELGPESARFHADLAENLVQSGVELVFLSGSDMAHLFAALPTRLRSGHAPDSTALLPLVRAALRDGDVVLVKGSRGSRMKVITEGLKDAVAVSHAL